MPRRIRGRIIVWLLSYYVHLPILFASYFFWLIGIYLSFCGESRYRSLDPWRVPTNVSECFEWINRTVGATQSVSAVTNAYSGLFGARIDLLSLIWWCAESCARAAYLAGSGSLYTATDLVTNDCSSQMSKKYSPLIVAINKVTHLPL